MAFRFGDFVLDPARYELLRGRERLAAEPQVLELLAYLVRNRDRVVGKDELLEHVWEGRIVSDSAVSRAVREVRRLLGDSAADSRFLKTVYGRGFRFLGDEVTEAPSAEPLEEERENGPGKGGGEGVGPGPNPDPPPPVARPLPVSLTPLVGREREIDETLGLLEANRLLTLTGAAGTGKSRLALAVATRLEGRYADGAAFVPLAEVTEPAAVVIAVVRALGLTDAVGGSPLEALQLQLRERELLLVLDNFEQVLRAGPQVAELLRACPGVAALVTSRFVLGVEGEQEYTVPPLALPARDADDEARRGSPAVALFLHRARAAVASFDPSERELAYVAEICRRLDGLPLALELAASRIKVFPPEALWERLAGRLDLLSSPSRRAGRPHRTLEGALEWSHELLDEDERALLRRLTVFAGGFVLPAVVAVVGGRSEEETIELLSALVDKSLVERVESGDREPRFGLLETTRVYAVQRLREAGEEKRLRDAHSRWCLGVARRGAGALAGGDQERWLERLDAERPNLLAAMEWSRQGGELADGLAIAAALGRYWSARAAYREGRRELRALLDQPGIADVPLRDRVDALVALSSLTHLSGEYRASAEILEGAAALLAEGEDPERRAQVLNHRAWVALQMAPLDAAETLAREALAANEEQGGARGVAVALNNLGQIAFYRGDLRAAEERFRASLERRRQADDDRGVAFALANLAVARLLLGGESAPVAGWLREARSRVDRLGDPPLAAWIASLEARLEIAAGRPEAAIAGIGRSGFHGWEVPHPDGVAWLHLVLADARAALGELAAAREAVDRAGEIWDSIEQHWGRAATRLRRARWDGIEGRTRAARCAYSEVVEISERFGLTGLARVARDELAVLEARRPPGAEDPAGGG